MLWELTETSGVLGGWGGGFVGVHEIFFGGGGWGGESPKKGGLDSLQIYEANWQKKRSCFQDEERLRPQCTL